MLTAARRVCRLDHDGQREIMVEAAWHARVFRAGPQRFGAFGVPV